MIEIEFVGGLPRNVKKYKNEDVDITSPAGLNILSEDKSCVTFIPLHRIYEVRMYTSD